MVKLQDNLWTRTVWRSLSFFANMSMNGFSHVHTLSFSPCCTIYQMVHSVISFICVSKLVQSSIKKHYIKEERFISIPTFLVQMIWSNKLDWIFTSAISWIIDESVDLLALMINNTIIAEAKVTFCSCEIIQKLH